MSDASMDAMIDAATKRNIIVNDNDYNKNNQYMAAGRELENILTEYITVLDQLSSASSGKLADNLKTLQEITKVKLCGTIEENCKSFAKYMKEYKLAIDKADSGLYG